MKHFSFFAVFLFLIMGCSEKHLIKDEKVRIHVRTELDKQKKILKDNDPPIFDIIEKAQTPEEREALEFLLAYMPLNDLLDYSGDYFYNQVKITLRARKELSWGKSIPEEIFCHFVLPYRVGNENLDTFRIAVYEELKQRVAGMDMKKAALEINHWCHEKVTYKSTDARTSSPLSLMKTSWGRCGEEAVFTVNAMRTVGIPARQVYTPRWAHTDDNHAWVEVWINGEWYFLGACEPEPELNMGWFAEPVTRAMMVNASIYGYYDGHETVSKHRGKTTVLNVTANYAPVKQIAVKILNEDNTPANMAKVSFQLFNYGELTSIASKTTDTDGVVTLTTGLGDLWIWATDQIKFGYQKITVEKTDTITIALDKSPGKVQVSQFDLIPPIERAPKKVDARDQEKNKKRLSQEDKIRKAYMATFPDSASCLQYAQQFNVNSGRLLKILNKSAGNWEEIIHFVKQGISIDTEDALRLLEVISDKDLRDTKAAILLDHLKNCNNVKQEWKTKNYDDYVNYVLNPRIANENLVAYRQAIQQSFTDNQKTLFQADPSSLFSWAQDKITLIDDEDFSRVVITPLGVLKAKMADLYSLNVFFVATCRSLGIPARINRQSFTLEYFVRGEWRSVRFKEAKDTIVPKGYLQLSTKEKDFDPSYYKHWTISRYENGTYHTVGLGWDTKISELTQKIELNIGDYMISTGIRENDGTVLCRLDFFRIEKGETTNVEARFRKSEEKMKVLGKVDLQTAVQILATGEEQVIADLVQNREAIFIWIDPDKEPTKHVMGDLNRLKEQFEKWNGKIVLLFEDETTAQQFDTKRFAALPSNCVFVYDKKTRLLKSIEADNHKLALLQYPVILATDSHGHYYYYSNGYKIGVGEQLVKILKRIATDPML